jgi:hypothetical protein
MSEDKYISIKDKSTYFHLKNIHDLLISTFDSNEIEDFEVQSELSSEKLKPLCDSMKNSYSYFFDKLSTQSKEIEQIKYLYIASIDSNQTFIDSYDSLLVINNADLSNQFLTSFTTSGGFIKQPTMEKYNVFEYNDSTYIGILYEISDHYSIVIIVEAYNDDSIPFELTDLLHRDMNYGFEILREDEVFLSSYQNPNSNIFEFAS